MFLHYFPKKDKKIWSVTDFQLLFCGDEYDDVQGLYRNLWDGSADHFSTVDSDG